MNLSLASVSFWHSSLVTYRIVLLPLNLQGRLVAAGRLAYQRGVLPLQGYHSLWVTDYHRLGIVIY